MSVNIFSQQILTALSAANYTQDRLPGDILVLPESMYDIKVKVNDLVVSETINFSLEKLYNNWLYMISKSIIPSNNIPNKDFANKMIVDNANGLSWIDTFETIDDFEKASASFDRNDSLLNGVEQITKIRNVADPDNYNIIANTTTNIILLSGTDTTSIDIIGNYFNQSNIILSNSDVTHPSNEILFRDIANHVVTDDNELFVLDKFHRTIFKFDISGILTLDRAILQNNTPGRLMTGMIGGPGDIQDKTRFDSPIVLETVDNLIYAIDHSASESAIKVFDSDLNWKQSVTLGNILSAGPLHMKYNDQTERFYILCHAGTTAFNNNQTINYELASEPATLVILDKNLQYVSTEPLNDDTYSTRINTQRYRKVYFSEENKNIMYVVTNKGVFKKYVSRPTRFIGQFLLQEKNIGVGDSVQDFADMSIFPTTVMDNDVMTVKDEILLMDKSRRVIFQFLEDSNYERSIQTEFDSKALFFDRMQVQDDEYVSTLTYNKVLTKHMYNNMLLLENTFRKFTTKFNRYGISQYIGFRYLNRDELQQINYTVPLDAYIGNNELLLSATINRCLNQILLLQENILDKMQEKSINVFPLLTSPVILNSPYIQIGNVAGLDTDGDGVPDDIDADDDDDGLTDAQELQFGSDPLREFTDDDAWSDYDEVMVHGTSPIKTDTDDDRVSDSSDVFPLDGSAWMDTDQDGLPDDVFKKNTVFDSANKQPVDEFHTRKRNTADGAVDDYYYGTDPNDPTAGRFEPERDEAGNVVMITGNASTSLVEDTDDDNDGYNDTIETWLEMTLSATGRTVDGQRIGLHTFSKNWRRVDGVDSDVRFIDAEGNDSSVPLYDTHGNVLTAANPDGIDDRIDIDIDGDTYLNFDYRNIIIVDPIDFYGSGKGHTFKTANLTVARQLAEMQQNVDYFVRVDENGLPMTHPDGSVMLVTEASAEFDNIITRADGVDTDSDGIDDLLDPDDDNDLLSDYTELNPTTNHPYTTDPLDPDTDDDTLTDYQEYQLGTNPTSEDTDSDMDKYLIDKFGNIITVGLSGRDDRDEFPTDPAAFRDTDQDGLPDEFVYRGKHANTDALTGVMISTTGLTEDTDDDRDFLEDTVEQELGTDPKDPDTDDDTLTDYEEQQLETNPLVAKLELVGDVVLPTLTKSETFTGVLSSDTELRGLFHNPDYLRQINTFTLSSSPEHTNTNDMFTIDSAGLALTTPPDFETLAANPLSATFRAFDLHDAPSPEDDELFVLRVIITDEVEDTDSDGIVDPVDETRDAPGLQFKTAEFGGAIYRGTYFEEDVLGEPHKIVDIRNVATVQENQPSQVIQENLDDLFSNENVSSRRGEYTLRGGQSNQAATIDGTKLTLNSLDYETLFTNPGDKRDRMFRIKVNVVDNYGNRFEIRYQITVTNTDAEDTDSDGILDDQDLTPDTSQLQLSGGSLGVVDGNNMTVNWPTSVFENKQTHTNIISLTSLFDNPEHILEDDGIELIQGQDLFSITPTTSTLQLLSGADFESLSTGDHESRYASAVVQVKGKEETPVIQTLTFNVSVTNQTIYNIGTWNESHVSYNDVDLKWQTLSSTI